MKNVLQNFNRNNMLKTVKAHAGLEWDIAIIGGGATGLGIAVDSASRGYKTLLLEGVDFAKGTSSKSTKLVHGGVRYLAQGDLSLVFEALRERGLLLRNASHLVHNREFLIPTYSWWDGPYYALGMKIYDKMAGRLGFGASVKLNRKQTLLKAPELNPVELTGGVIYHDGQFDDSRLALNLAQTAYLQGACLLNYTRVVGLTKGDMSMITGLKCVDDESGTQFTVKAKAVINAAGVFAGEVLGLDEKKAPRYKILPSQGAHVVLDKSFLKSECAILIPKTDDGRVLFAVPWHGKVVVGTTDTPVEHVTLDPKPLEEEIEFILSTAAQYLSKAPKRSDVLSAFAGLRPLVVANETGDSKTTKEVSRSHKVDVSESGLISVLGGKWTTYRKMAEDAVNQAQLLVALDFKSCVTETLRIHGALDKPVSDIEHQDPEHVWGSDRPLILELEKKRPELSEPLHPDLPYRYSHVVFACHFEMARTVEDVLARRTRSLFLNARASLACAAKVAETMARELKKDKSWQVKALHDFQVTASEFLLEPHC